MGNQLELSQNKFNDGFGGDEKDISSFYRRFFEKFSSNPQYLSIMLNENPKLAPGLLKFFPNCDKDYQQFFEMVTFLQKFQINSVKNQFVKYNAPGTNLLERYLMLINGISRYEELDRIKLGDYQLEELFLQLMKLFIPDPQKGQLLKLKRFLKIENTLVFTIKEFCTILNNMFPYINKHIKDYITIKFRYRIKQGCLLQRFRSNIIKNQAVILAFKVPQLTGKQIKRLYSNEVDGNNFFSLEKNIIGYAGPWLLLVQSVDDQVYKFGSFQSGPILDIGQFQGDSKGFMFTIEPNIRFMTSDKGDNPKHFFYINTIDEIISKQRKGLGFGGDNHKQDFKLWIDEEFKKSTVYNGNDLTYGYGFLANPMSTALNIKKIEVWGLGTKLDAEKQTVYWNYIEKEILRTNKASNTDNLQYLLKKNYVHRFFEEEERHKKYENYNRETKEETDSDD